MLSALTISPLNCFAMSIASFDFPEAVGPEIKIILDCMKCELINFHTNISASIFRIYNC